MGLERSQGRDVMAECHCDGWGPEVQGTLLTGPFSPLPPQRHPHSQAHALTLLTVLQGQVGSKLSVTHWGITREEGGGEGGLNGRRQVLRNRRFIICERQEDVNFSGEGKRTQNVDQTGREKENAK